MFFGSTFLSYGTGRFNATTLTCVACGTSFFSGGCSCKPAALLTKGDFNVEAYVRGSVEEESKEYRHIMQSFNDNRPSAKVPPARDIMLERYGALHSQNDFLLCS